MSEREPSLVRTIGEAMERSLPEDLNQLADDARALAEAEIAYQKSRASLAVREAKRIAILGLLAAALVFFALMALTVGLVIALTPQLTAWGAMAAVFAGLLAVAGLCGLTAAVRGKRLAARLSDKKPADGARK